MIARQRLRQIRNCVAIDRVLTEVGLPVKRTEGYLRFLCPLCREFNTATNPRTNLARCFRCEKNFNTIDLVMLVENRSFLEAVHHLESLLDDCPSAETRPSPFAASPSNRRAFRPSTTAFLSLPWDSPESGAGHRGRGSEGKGT